MPDSIENTRIAVLFVQLHRTPLEQMHVPHWLYLVIGADHVVAMKPLVDNHEDMDRFIRKFVNEQLDASAFTEWADKVPDSM